MKKGQVKSNTWRKLGTGSFALALGWVGIVASLLAAAAWADERDDRAVVDYLRPNATTLDVAAVVAGLDDTSIETAGKRLFLLGEVHGVAVNYAIDFALLRHLHRVAGVRIYLMEFSHAHAQYVNRYLETGNEAPLDFTLGQMHGFVDCSHERRQFFVNLHAWNLSLSSAERVRVVGIDLERMAGISLAYLQEQFDAIDLPADLRAAVSALRDLPVSVAPAPELARKLAADLSAAVSRHRAVCIRLLGARWFDAELALNNLQDRFRVQADRAHYDALRDAIQHRNFLRLAEHVPFEKAYGRTGSAHVLQRRTGGIDHFSTLLQAPGSKWAGAVVGIWPLYEKSWRLSFAGGRYGAVPCSDEPSTTRPFAAAAVGDLTLFNLTAEGSPFSSRLVLPQVANGGVSTDYFQYVVLMKSSPAATPISPASHAVAPPSGALEERQLTHAPHGHVLTNVNVWSPDSRWIVYDVRGVDSVFDGTRIEQVDVNSGEVKILYESKNGATCGVVTYDPRESRVVFIHGPEHPDSNWSYGLTRRRGAIVDVRAPGRARPLDAMNYAPPFVPGALRGGSHVHVFSPDGGAVSFTYEDEALSRLGPAGDHDVNQRNIGVSIAAGRGVTVARSHPRNHDGDWFSLLVSRTVNRPRPGSDEINRAFEEGWIPRRDGRRSLAFLGNVTAPDGREHAEVFVVELPPDLTRAGAQPLEGTTTLRPAPPDGVVQRRVSFTADRKFPGVVLSPRHWARASPDGTEVACLMKDDAGVVQLWCVGVEGGNLRQVTRHPTGIGSAFTWSPDGRSIAHTMDGSVCVTEVASGNTRRLTERREGADAPEPFACVFSPDGRRVAYTRRVAEEKGAFAQIFCVEVPARR